MEVAELRAVLHLDTTTTNPIPIPATELLIFL